MQLNNVFLRNCGLSVVAEADERQMADRTLASSNSICYVVERHVLCQPVGFERRQRSETAT